MAGAAHGGAETAFVDMCLALHDKGQDVVVVTRPNPVRVPRLRQAGLTVYTLPFGGRVDFYTGWRIRHIIRAFQPHIVQTWMARAPRFVRRWTSKSGQPQYTIVARLGSPYKFKYFASSEYFIAITPLIKKYIVSHGVSEDRVIHINNFADTQDAVQPVDRKTYGIPEEAPLILGLGRLHPSKAFDTLIRVVAQMPAVFLWIAGEGPERKNLEGLIRELGVAGRVKLIGWQTDRASLFKESDVCAFISRTEGFGTVFVQAWAHNVPVVVCEADGPRQYIRHRQDGMMAPIDDIPAIKACLQNILDDASLRRTVVENGYHRYRSEFTKESCVAAYLAFYESLCRTASSNTLCRPALKESANSVVKPAQDW